MIIGDAAIAKTIKDFNNANVYVPSHSLNPNSVTKVLIVVAVKYSFLLSSLKCEQMNFWQSS